VDEECFSKTCQEVLGLEGVSTDWGSYKHSTDSGIVDQIFREAVGRPPNPSELQRFIAHFVSLMDAVHRKDARRFQVTRGVERLFEQLVERDWSVGIATGAFRASAELKLKLTGIAPLTVPLSTADEAFDRTEIIRRTMQKILEASPKVTEVEGIVYVGDGLWDWKASRALPAGFVGVTAYGDLSRFAKVGVQHVVPHFEERDRFFQYLEEASQFER